MAWCHQAHSTKATRRHNFHCTSRFRWRTVRCCIKLSSLKLLCERKKIRSTPYTIGQILWYWRLTQVVTIRKKYFIFLEALGVTFRRLGHLQNPGWQVIFHIGLDCIFNDDMHPPGHTSRHSSSMVNGQCLTIIVESRQRSSWQDMKLGGPSMPNWKSANYNLQLVLEFRGWP